MSTKEKNKQVNYQAFLKIFVYIRILIKYEMCSGAFTRAALKHVTLFS